MKAHEGLGVFSIVYNNSDGVPVSWCVLHHSVWDGVNVRVPTRLVTDSYMLCLQYLMCHEHALQLNRIADSLSTARLDAHINTRADFSSFLCSCVYIMLDFCFIVLVFTRFFPHLSSSTFIAQ